MLNYWQPFGYEQFIFDTNPLLSKVGRITGELHYGLKVRYFYLSTVLDHSRFPIKKILDAGCARGQTVFWLARRFPDSQVTGIDINPNLVNYCSSLAGRIGIKNVEFKVADLPELTGDEFYDLILCIDVLEHIQDWQTALHKIINRLSSEGAMIIHVPHKSKYLGPSFGLRRLKRKGKHLTETETENELIGATHIHEGFQSNDFAILAQLPVRFEIRKTFGPLSMYLHTIFEMYRGASRLWHIILTPLLSTIAWFESKVQLQDGGGLLIVLTKDL